MAGRATRQLFVATLAAFGVLVAWATPAAGQTPWELVDGDITIGNIGADLDPGGYCDTNPLSEAEFDFSTGSGNFTITDLSVWFPVEVPPSSGSWYAAHLTLFPPNGGGTPHGTYSGGPSIWGVGGDVRLLFLFYGMPDYGNDDCGISDPECVVSSWVDINNGLYFGDIEDPSTDDDFDFDIASQGPTHADVHGCNVTYISNVLDGEQIAGALEFEHD